MEQRQSKKLDLGDYLNVLVVGEDEAVEGAAIVDDDSSNDIDSGNNLFNGNFNSSNNNNNNNNYHFYYYTDYSYNYSDDDPADDADFDLDSLLHDLTGPPPSSSSSGLFYLILGLYVSVIVVGVLGNSLVLIAVIGKEKMRTPRNLFISTLAVSDLFLCLFSLPITLWELFVEAWPFGPRLQWLCRCMLSFQLFPVFMSSLAIAAIAQDRYRCVVQADER